MGGWFMRRWMRLGRGNGRWPRALPRPDRRSDAALSVHAVSAGVAHAWAAPRGVARCVLRVLPGGMYMADSKTGRATSADRANKNPAPLGAGFRFFRPWVSSCYTNPIPAPDRTVIRSTRRRRAEVSASGRRTSRAPKRAAIAVCGWLLRCVMDREKHGRARRVNSYFDNDFAGRLRCRCRSSFSAAASHWRSPRALPAARCRPPSRQASYSTGSM